MKKYKATVSFAGEICMAVNEVRDIPEDVAAPLLKCGYLIEATPSVQVLSVDMSPSDDAEAPADVPAEEPATKKEKASKKGKGEE